MSQSESKDDRKQLLVMHAVNAILNNCGNSYANKYTEEWLLLAKEAGAYHGPTTGTIEELGGLWDEWLESNGGLPELTA
jgi:hypothetical protein